MRRNLLTAVFALAVVTLAVPASAQSVYPEGYVPGYGGGLPGSFYYDAARANAINAETYIRLNDYESRLSFEELVANKLRVQRNRGLHNDKQAQADRRYFENATALDVASGDALNAVLVKLTAPNLYGLGALRQASTTVPGDLIRRLPFRNAPAGFTICIDRLIHGGAPPVLKHDVFAAERAELHDLDANLRRQAGDRAGFDRATLARMRDLIESMLVKVAENVPSQTPARHDAEDHLKASSWLAGMMGTPAVDVFFAGMDDRPEANLGELVAAMKASGLRFGVAETPGQRAVYDELYSLLIRLHAEASSPRGATARARSGERVGGLGLIADLGPEGRAVAKSPASRER